LECFTLWTEFQKIKAGAGTVNAATGTGADGLAGAGAAADGSDGAGCVALEAASVGFQIDPAMTRAKVEAAGNADHIHRFWGDDDAVKRGLALVQGYIYKTQRVNFLVDARTSRIKIMAQCIEFIKNIIDQSGLDLYSVAVTCQDRLDYMAAAQAKFKEAFHSKVAHYVCAQEIAASQSARRKTKFVLVAHSGEAQLQIPAMLPALRGKGRGWEGVRKRCLP
jgi:hypothetical protein